MNNPSIRRRTHLIVAIVTMILTMHTNPYPTLTLASEVTANQNTLRPCIPTDQPAPDYLPPSWLEKLCSPPIVTSPVYR